MEIEKAIKQTNPFRNEYQKLTVNLLYTHSRLKEHLGNFFDEFSLTTKQYNILRILKGAGKPVSTLFIRERMLDRMSDTSRIIDRMQKKGIVDKRSCDQDKRLIDVSINTKGEDLLNRIENHIKQLDNMFSVLSEEEAKQLNKLLDKSRTNIS